jgi:hypothetical protein
MLPLFFQVVLLDSAAKAGARLAIPSLAGPIGGIFAGYVMSHFGHLIPLVRTGATFLAIGNGLVTSLGFTDSVWKYFVYIFPANMGTGIIYPSTLFTNLATFEHSGGYSSSLARLLTARLLTWLSRPCGVRINHLRSPLHRRRLGRGNHLRYPANDPEEPATSRFGGY